MPFQFEELEIPNLIVVTSKVFSDQRGFFLETYKKSEFQAHGIQEVFVQDNHSQSSYGVLRGLHYQKEPKAQGKLVRCIQGKILDVAVDLRKGSSAFKKWIGVELTQENHKMLYIPPGFAHGFLVLSEMAEVIYKCTQEYDPLLDRNLNWKDPEINIAWPIKYPVLSQKDQNAPFLKEIDL